MAKSELVDVLEGDEDEGFDQEALLEENLADLPEEQDPRGRWRVQWVSAKVKSGVGKKGPWARVNIAMDPVYPAGEEADEVAAEYDLDDLPRGYHGVFYTTTADKRTFIALAKKFGVEPAPLKEMIAAAKGQEAIATISRGKDNLGREEMKFSAFTTAEN